MSLAEYNRARKEGRVPSSADTRAYLASVEAGKYPNEAFKQAGIAINNSPLDRTTADIVAGKRSVPTKQLNPEQQDALKRYYLNQRAFRGEITPEEYGKEIGIISNTTMQQQNERSERFAREAAVKGKSETTKQDTAREVAARQGAAIGTITSTGAANVSQNSQVAQVSNVQRFVESQRPPPTNQNYSVELNETLGLNDKAAVPEQQGPPKPTYNYLVELKEGRQPQIMAGSLEFIYGTQKEKIKRDSKSDNPIISFGDSLYNALRYSDLVESGEIKKPEGLALLPHYASKGLSVLYNIPLALTGQKTNPTLSDTVFDTGFQLVTKGKTETHDPIGDYIRKDPIGTLVQAPAEGALFITGSKAVSAGTSAVKKYSPLQYQSKQILTNEGKVSTVIRSITVSGEPKISVQSGKLVKGYDPSKIPYQNINVSTREGFEGALGTGIEKEIFYSPKALSSQVSRGIIPEISRTRATAWVDAVYQAKGITSKGGLVGETPIEGLTAKQTKSIFDVVTKEQGKTIEQLHGSIGTRAAVPESIQKEAGSALLPKDVDVIPKGKNLPRTADELVQKFARSFPLEPGQRLKILNLRGKEDANRALELYDPTTKEPRKILEVVLRKSDESKYGIGKGDRILNIRIPTKPTKLKDWGIKVSTPDYQLLTNVKQALAYQKGSATKFDIYTSSGRSKDIVRAYWNLKGKAVFAGGEEGKRLDKKADYIRSLYPGLEFTDVKPEKVLLYSSEIGKSTSQSSITGKALSQSPKMTRPDSFEKKVESIKDERWDNIGTSIVFGKDSDSTVIAAVRTDLPNIIGINTNRKWTERDIDDLPNTFTHETTHQVLDKIGEPKAAFQLDLKESGILNLKKNVLETSSIPDSLHLENINKINAVFGTEFFLRPSPKIKGKDSFESNVKKTKDESLSFSRTEQPKINSNIQRLSQSSLGSSRQPNQLSYRLLTSMGSSRSVVRTNRMLESSVSNRPSQRQPPSRTSVFQPPSRKPNTSIKEPPSLTTSLIGPPSTFPPSIKPPRFPPTKTPPVKFPPVRPPSTRQQDNKLSMLYNQRKPPVAAIFDIKNTTKKAKGLKGESHNFLGWTKVAEIGGARTRTKDIDVGDKRTAKLYQDDILGTTRGYKKSDRKNMLSLKKKSKSSLF